MQQNDCYLSAKQEKIMEILAELFRQQEISKIYEVTGKGIVPSELKEYLTYADLLAFENCGFISSETSSETYINMDTYDPYEVYTVIYKFDHIKILDYSKSNFIDVSEPNEAFEIPIEQETKNMSQIKNYNGLSEAHLNFLELLAKAFKGKYLTNKTKSTFYIRPKEEGGNIVDFEGFAPIFLNGHRKELCVPLKIFLDLASLGYLEKARYGHYHVKDKKIIPVVNDYLAQREGTVTRTIAFRLPDSSAQFKCDIFMVMPFREELKPVYTDHIKPLVEGMNYSVKRGDDTFSHHDIITEIWSLINNAKLIIADCTGKNANVFYELGLAHAIDKPVIIITQDEEDIPFDIRQRRYIKYEYTPRGMKQFEEELKKAIQSILGE